MQCHIDGPSFIGIFSYCPLHAGITNEKKKKQHIMIQFVEHAPRCVISGYVPWAVVPSSVILAIEAEEAMMVSKP